MPHPELRILFVCTGNACRSQMAEGWARHFGGEQVAVASAGIEAHGINPKAVAVMQEAGVDISTQTSQRIDPKMVSETNIVVTVCDHAKNSLPPLPESCRQYHWSLPDPAKAVGTKKQIAQQFRNVRDDLKQRVKTVIDNRDKG